MPVLKRIPNLVPIVQVVDRGEDAPQIYNIVERNSHASACEGMPHIPRIPKKDDALLGKRASLLYWRKERVRHAPNSVFGERVAHSALDRNGQLRKDVCQDVRLNIVLQSEPSHYHYVSTHPEIRRKGMLDVDEHARVVLGYLVEQNRTAALWKDDCAMASDRENGILKNCAYEIALCGRFAGSLPHHDVAEIGETPVCDDD